MSFVSRNHPQQVRRDGADDSVDDRRTPLELMNECMELTGVEGFDLDPAATAESAKAAVFFTAADDGLAQPWFGRVWLNPPYSDLGAWVSKAVAERPRCECVVMLLPSNRTEQSWWQDLIEPERVAGRIEVFFLRGRRRFDRPDWTAPKKGDRPPFGLCVVKL